MKTLFVLFFSLFLMVSCHVTGNMADNRLTGPEYFSRYTSLADALKVDPGLIVTGSGGNATVRLRKSTGSVNREPLYVVDGYSVGNNYQMADQLVNMATVRRIRVLRDATQLTVYGEMGANGVIEIITTRSESGNLASSRG